LFHCADGLVYRILVNYDHIGFPNAPVDPTCPDVAHQQVGPLPPVPAKHPSAAMRHWSARSSAATTAGVAGPTASPADLHRCYREAIDTMEALLTLGRIGAVVTAEQLGIYRVLLNHTGRRELEAQFDEALGVVVAEQKRRNLPMLATLKAFLDHGCRAAPTARTLGVHVNTLYQRIAVLDRLLGPDWRQPPRSLDLHVLLRVFPNTDPRLVGRDA
jgi:DNA-binding PucR family transcriptional regulator